MVKTNLIVVSRPLLVIDQRSVGLLDLHELIFSSFIVFVQVWMIEHGEFQPGLSDLSLMNIVLFKSKFLFWSLTNSLYMYYRVTQETQSGEIRSGHLTWHA